MLSYEIPGKTWECVRTDIFSINNMHYLFTVDYHRKFPVIKQVKGFSADNLIKTHMIIFAEYQIPSSITSDAGTNFVS